MAGSGIAVRLHEFKETSSPSLPASARVRRQGRDTVGLYPGQVGRVHAAPPSNDSRARFSWASPREEHYPESFDLQTLRALQLARTTSGPDGRSAATSHQEAFGSLSCFYPPGDRMYTPVSHPGPLRSADPPAI
ncbi:hypothetical protein COCON_G00039590 [Conger conger]|uniref:Uncharacterized protein n=1 Tax=Conger conger TaxID=82655 RepID=A0A9Q1E0E7_CONCO|nr:hypothetical protein COCON_G00039590 [Conger conger]